MRVEILLLIFRCLIPLAKHLLQRLKSKELRDNKDERRIYLLKKFINLMEIEKCSKTMCPKSES